MLKMLSTAILACTLLLSNTTAASTIDELYQAMQTSLKNGNYSSAMNSGDELIDKLIAEKQFKTALELSAKFAEATSPEIAKFGLMKLSSVYKAVYDSNGNKEMLVMAGASLIQVSKSDDVLSFLSMYAKEYDEVNPKSYFYVVKSRASEMETDKVLRASFNHIQYGRWELVKMYLKKEVIDVNSTLSNDGTSLLHMATWYNKQLVVKELVEKYNADINLEDKEGDTPLKYAQHQKFLELVRYIQSNGGTL
ncbi:MAG: ankyrin repeat domain-containing protein [Aliivibrio sp.]|uniref:ankyrin repeat domain-containing protein n=1 Tax=Aliivibrio sp. TaxID=1872443 RepID=UPI001A385AC8|nr:ankyrin repeat domain-containing protein [Aliivibrio sp.]